MFSYYFLSAVQILVEYTLDKMETKLNKIKSAAASGDWRTAILIAAKFGELGEQRNAILSAREAYLRPEFQKQLRRDPDALIAAGINALKERYWLSV